MWVYGCYSQRWIHMDSTPCLQLCHTCASRTSRRTAVRLVIFLPQLFEPLVLLESTQKMTGSAFFPSSTVPITFERFSASAPLTVPRRKAELVVCGQCLPTAVDALMVTGSVVLKRRDTHLREYVATIDRRRIFNPQLRMSVDFHGPSLVR